MKDRLQHLQKYYTANSRVLEIGPYFNPIFPKRAFANVFTIDIYDQDALVENAQSDTNINPELISNIEPVDFIWKHSLSQTIASKSVLFDLIVSSHNFEHQPDPIKFLLDCEASLSDGGVLSMAIPTATRCFDAMRPLTTTGTWIDFFDRHVKPTFGIWFDNNSNFCRLVNGHIMNHGTFDSSDLRIDADILKLPYTDEERNFNDYRDAHCSVLTMESLKLILYDLDRIGLVSRLKMFDCIDGDFEFIVHFSKSRVPMSFYNEDRCTLTVRSMEYYLKELNSLFAKGNTKLGV